MNEELITMSDAVAAEGTEALEAQETKGKDKEILAHIRERKTTAKHEKERIREISKKIKNCIRYNKRRIRYEKNQKMLEQVKGTRNISSIKSVKKRILIPKVKNKEGETIKTRQGIANVFAKFYEDLYEGEEGDTGKETNLRTEEDVKDPDQQNSIPELQKMRFKMSVTASKKEKQKTTAEFELNSSKIAVTLRKKKSERSTKKLRNKMTLHQKAGAKSESK